jgi:hypothetical protein
MPPEGKYKKKNMSGLRFIMYICMCILIYIYTCMYILIYVYIYMHVYILVRGFVFYI